MDKPNSQPPNKSPHDISPSELSPVTSSEADYSQSPLMAEMHHRAFFYDHAIAQDIYEQQNFNLQYQPSQTLFPIDTDQSWVGSLLQQPYVLPAPSPSPEKSPSVPKSQKSSSVRHDYVPLAKRPSIATSGGSAYSDGDEHSAHDEVGEKRRERRRAQNRAAQRAFRARKEETIKESSTRLDALQEELGRLQSNNSTLSETISTLHAQMEILQRENTQLKRKSIDNLDWDNFNMSGMDPESLSETLRAPELKTELSNDSGVFDVSSTSRQASQPQCDAKDAALSVRAGQQPGAALIAEAMMDAVTGMEPRR